MSSGSQPVEAPMRPAEQDEILIRTESLGKTYRMGAEEIYALRDVSL